MSNTPETDAVEKHCEDLLRAYHTDRMRVGDDRELAKVMIQVTRELLTVSRALERKLAAAPEARSHVPIKVRPMLVSGMLAKDERGPVILLDSEQEPEQQVLAFWHEVLHLVGLKDEVRAEETAMILAGACPTILRAVCDNINVPDSGLGMNSEP